jgi:hypothetical protein
MATVTSFTGITLEGNPGDLPGGPVKIKLFHDKGGEDRYAELYTNIDLATRKLVILEKDEDYRRRIIQALQSD